MSIWSKFTGKDMRDAAFEANRRALVRELEAEAREKKAGSALAVAESMAKDAKLDWMKAITAETSAKEWKTEAENAKAATIAEKAQAANLRIEAEQDHAEAVQLKNTFVSLNAATTETLEKVRQAWLKASDEAQQHARFAINAVHMQGVRDVMDKLRPVQGEPRAVDSFRPCSIGHRAPTLTKENIVRCATCGQKVDQA